LRKSENSSEPLSHPAIVQDEMVQQCQCSRKGIYMANDLTVGTRNQFGGVHTADKLERVRQYLVEYTTTMKDKGFRLAYIDAFAGSGSYRPTRGATKSAGQGFFLMPAAQEFDGSARIALGVKPRFDKYIFIDKNPKNISKLRLLREEYPNLCNDMRIKRGDANACLTTLCGKFDWTRWRAVMFLDPYGMQVEWATIETIARTRAIDIWCLFPLGVAVNRLLRRDGQINIAMSRRLDRMFGSHDWYGAFYKTLTGQHLLGKYTKIVKVGGLNQIGEYYVDRLRSVFAGVARRPLRLHKRSIPLYWLCFAAGGNNGVRRRVGIAEKILAAPRVRRGT
jgi:three-Cys-motif partner protein